MVSVDLFIFFWLQEVRKVSIDFLKTSPCGVKHETGYKVAICRIGGGNFQTGVISSAQPCAGSIKDTYMTVFVQKKDVLMLIHAVFFIRDVGFLWHLCRSSTVSNYPIFTVAFGPIMILLIVHSLCMYIRREVRWTLRRRDRSWHRWKPGTWSSRRRWRWRRRPTEQLITRRRSGSYIVAHFVDLSRRVKIYWSFLYRVAHQVVDYILLTDFCVPSCCLHTCRANSARFVAAQAEIGRHRNCQININIM